MRPRLVTLAAMIFALGGLHGDEFVERDTLLFGEADSGSGRRADIVVGHGLGRAGDFDFDVGLLGDDAADPRGQAARTTEGFDRGAFAEVLGGEVLLKDGFQFGDGAGEHAGGNFLGTNFEEEFDARGGLRSGGDGRGSFDGTAASSNASQEFPS